LESPFEATSYPGDLKIISILMPDPQFKNRYKKRRTVTSGLIKLLSERQKSGGRLIFQTDVISLFEDMKDVLSMKDIFYRIEPGINSTSSFSHGHNVLSFGGALHDAIDCFATIKTNATTTFINSFNSTSGIITPSPVGHALLGCILESNESSCTVIDMTASFALQGVVSASRRFALSLDRSILYLSDRWIMNSSTSFNATSSFHTFATVVIPSDSRSAILTLGGESITLQFSNKGECNGLAKFSSTEINLEPPENSSVGLIRIDAIVESASICNGLDIEIIR